MLSNRFAFSNFTTRLCWRHVTHLTSVMPTRPQVSIPQGAQAPTNPSPSSRAFAEYYRSISQEPTLMNPWDTPQTARPRATSLHPTQHSNGHLQFPEPQVYRSTSARQTTTSKPSLPHKHSRSELVTPSSLRLQSHPSSYSLASSYYQYDNDSYSTGSTEVKAYHLLFSQALTSSSLMVTRRKIRKCQKQCK